ncbi:tetratricopeptide repeat protein [Roseimaritima ulvae]|uniref:Uncharacterized protein n=1 Tax=Roseimaritima ulvae TaxID=980254 RepID=A0A5B9QS62_9BACT|nr:tetratricopeptide repeat protein [Roseimaritima ulvae]QEG41937.1 hypothetical protein UC8_39650 [Roseimaritima ulvae]
MRRMLLTFCLLSLLPVTYAVACLWDSETLEQERNKFPGTLEVITGNFPRHSPAFYQWRLDDRLNKLANDPDNDRWLDDVAVSYEKLGRHSEAIEVAESQLQRNPDRYETLANLATFLIHDGQWEAGLRYIDRALEVNPDAHFGRERYQRLLVQYLLQNFPDGQVEYPLAAGDRIDFPTFLVNDQPPGEDGQPPKLSIEQRQAAVQGVVGMMRFSQHDHPVLLEVLGQLLTETYRPKVDAKQLAARCYLLLADSAASPATQAAYEQLAKKSLNLQATHKSGSEGQMGLRAVRRELSGELAAAKKRYNSIVLKEKRWIASGVDVEAAYRQYVNSVQW